MIVKTDNNDLIIEAAYQSEERAVMDGYEYAFDHPTLGPIYRIETEDGYSYATIEGFC